MIRNVRAKYLPAARLRMCFILFFLPATEPGYGQGSEAEKILHSLEKRYSRTMSVSCRFAQTRVTSRSPAEIKLTGTITFKKPHFLRMQAEGDEKIDLFCNEKGVWIVHRDSQKVETFKAGQFKSAERLSQFIPPLFLDSIDEITKQYKVEVVHRAEGKTRLRLKPLPGRKSSFVSLLFDMDRLSRISWMKVTFKNGDYSETAFRSWRSLPKISDAIFQYRR